MFDCAVRAVLDHRDISVSKHDTVVGNRYLL